MSFKITYNQASNPNFQMALGKLSQTPADPKTSYILSKITREFKKLRETISDAYKKELMEPFAERNDKGEFDPENWVVPEDKREEFEKKQEEFGKRDATILRPLLTLGDIKNAKLSPLEMEALEPILDERSFEKPEPPAQLKVGRV